MEYPEVTEITQILLTGNTPVPYDQVTPDIPEYST